ncbi:hypothetical protein ACFQ45_01285 [Rhodanobacter aciditrophus]|uniref:Uncharacterized protein n=1 Tax=Rhodanobacter aciditrophus TaxID=1623218 RepID=A0ABW4AXK5_9GAMM
MGSLIVLALLFWGKIVPESLENQKEIYQAGGRGTSPPISAAGPEPTIVLLALA